MLVRGGRGTGRSALLAEIARRQAAAGTTVLAVAALPGDRRLPGAGLQRLLEPVRRQAGTLPASLARLSGGFDQEAVAAVAERLSATGPLLWCVDDIDRLDELSRDAILGQRSARILASSGGPVTALTPYEIDLHRLRPAQAAALLGDMSGIGRHPGTRLVLAQAAGNPLALVELARNLAAGPAVTPTTTELPVPPRLRRALAPAVDALDPVRMRAALLAAFAAETPGAGTATALGVLVSPEVWDWLVSDGVLRPGRRRRFTHPVVRAAVIARAGHADCRDARHQLAAMLPVSDPARAWHTARAEPAPDDDTARALDRAGTELLAGGRLRASAYALGLAARLSTTVADARSRGQRAAYSAHLAGEEPWAAQLTAVAGDEAQPIATTAGSPITAVAGSPITPAAGHPKTSTAGSPVGAGAEPVEVPEIAPLLLRAWLRGDDESRAAVRETFGRPITAPIVGVWARAIVEDADPDGEAERMLHQNTRAARRDPMSPDQREMVLGTIALARHDTPAAIRYMARSAELISPGSLHVPIAHCGLAGARYDAGELSPALTHAALVLDAVAPGADGLLADLRAGALAVIASVATLREDPSAQEAVREARSELRPSDQAAHDLRLVRAQGLIAGMRGRHELAFRRLRRLFHPDGRPVHHRVSDLGLADLARVAVVLGRADDVRQMILDALPRITALRSVRATAIHNRALALLAGPDESAETHFRLALADPGSEVWAIERAMTRMDYAEWLRRRQRPAESRPLLAAARDVFAAAGLTAWQERAEAELAAAAPPARSGAAGLTPQQRQVVTLAAQGLTNPQIATRLGLSARTVGIHLSRAYPILGVHRRSQLPLVMQ
ncbi:LuxR family transcriptional regulator [Actinoplanes sp. OR16]|nr:LuxR family transcriptional regulator [Actinoplanes sp. OR16]